MYRRHQNHSHNSSNMSSYNCGGIKILQFNYLRSAQKIKLFVAQWLILAFYYPPQCPLKTDRTCSMLTPNCTPQPPDKNHLKCKALVCLSRR